MIRLVTAAEVLPVSIEDLKDHLRISYNDTEQDIYLESLLKSAVFQAEGITGRAFTTQSWTALFDSWADAIGCTLPYGQLQSVSSVKYNDENGNEQTVSPDTYRVYGIGTDSGKIVIPADSDFDYPSLYEKDPVMITFVCGWSTAALVPMPIKTAIKLIVSGLYEDLDIEAAVYAHLRPYRIWSAA